MTPPDDEDRSTGTQIWARKVLDLIGEPATGYLQGAPPVTRAENARLSKLPLDELATTDLTRASTKELFSEEYMERLKDIAIKGVGDPKLKDLLREIDKGLAAPRRPPVMTDLAKIVGVPPTAERLDLDYGRFLVVRKQQAVNGKKKDEGIDPLDEGKHPDFMASRGQLLFGTVLGDAFGIHAVFAALLSPTGGLVGPANWLIPGVVKARHLAADNPIALHGTVHDAAGYLLTFHGEGPGYNYRESKIEILSTESPLSGQISGIAYWVKVLGEEFLEEEVAPALIKLERKLKDARNAVASKINGLISKFTRKKKKAVKTAKDVSREFEALVEDIADAVHSARDQAERARTQPFETAQRAIGKMRDKAKSKLKAAWSFVRS